MLDKKKIIVVIPARGGSKRVLKKNIIKICHKPMITWTLTELIKFVEKEQIIVSSDDQEIIEIVKKFGIDVPFIRPKELSDDFTLPEEAVKHALAWYEKNICKIDYILIVYPTAIFIEKEDLLNACKLITKNINTSVVFSAVEFAYPIQRAIRLDKENNIEMFFPDHYKTRTQDLQKTYHDAGQFYLCKSEVIRQSLPLFNKKSKFIQIPKIRAIDIDYMEDIKLAEAIMHQKLSITAKK
tara:strand:+ start:2088 stop:2807 length:720 start_codon:yes stop_codon:yes gene_type:complete